MSRTLPASGQVVIGGKRSPVPPESEAHFQAFVIRTAQGMGYRVYHTHDSRRSESGFPDLFMLRAGRAIAAELKSEVGRVSEAQKEWLAALQLANIEAYVWRPSDKSHIVVVLR